MPKPAPVQADPLADLRDDSDTTPVVATIPATAPVEARRDDFANRRSLIIATWHRDPTASSFGHSGGTCGCYHLATKALEALGG